MRRILIIIFILLAAWAGVWFFYIKPKEKVASPVPNILKPFFPSTTTNTGSFGEDGSALPTPGSGSAAVTNSPFTQLTSRPVAGFTIFSLSNTISIPNADPKLKPTVKTVVDNYLRYVSRNNGYVYEIKNGGIPLQISNIFIPNIYEALFADSNNTALLRFLRQDGQTIATYSVPIPSLNSDNTRTQKSGTYLSDNILALAVSPDQTKLARITTDQNGAIISTSSSVGTGTKTLVRSPFQEWLLQWTPKNIYAQTKAAATAEGFLYSVDQGTARLRRAAGNVNGLTTSVSPQGTYILYSESANNSFTTKIFNAKTNATSNISLAIMPEKCAWLKNEDLICAGNNSVPSATYPDDWYSGIVHFSDQLYRITASTNTYTVIYNGQPQSFDMTNLSADEANRIVYFIDKTTGLLWQYKY